MTEADLLGSWFEPATDAKSPASLSRSKKRKNLGAKGVGRFASASLGRYLKLTTAALQKGKLETHQLDIDWKVFESTKYLEDVDIEIKSPDVSFDKAGVTIEISHLSHIWTADRIKGRIQLRSA